MNNYNELMNKPRINNIELIGNMNISDLGGLTPEEATAMITEALGSYYTKTEIDSMIDYTEPVQGGE